MRPYWYSYRAQRFFSTCLTSLKRPTGAKWTQPVRTVSNYGNPSQKRYPTFLEEMQNLYSWIRRPSTASRGDLWIAGDETVVFHIARDSLAWRLMGLFPYIVITTGTSIGINLWFAMVQNPKYDPLNRRPEEPVLVPAPTRKRVYSILATASVCVALIVAVVETRRRLVRTIAFRIDKPRVSAQYTRRKGPNHGEKVAVIKSASGHSTVAPMYELELLDTKKPELLAVKRAGYRGRYLVDVEDAQIGWPGVTNVMEPYSSSPQSKSAQKTEHYARAKHLVGELWAIHSKPGPPKAIR